MPEKFYKYISPVLAFLFIILALGMIHANSQGASFNDNDNFVVYPQNELNPVIETSQNNPAMPIDRASDRVTKKPFGIYVTPQNSPVNPERFTGYHTGTDFETFPEEADLDVTVNAILPGKIVYKKWTSGYGGLLVEESMIDNSPVTIIYGHLNLYSIDKKIGSELTKGERIGVLGKGYSKETDGERKHLHLAIHKGTVIDLKGYVKSKNELNNWIDPDSLL
ncbi:MAG TPA: M23 family metallopeptidase [Patescibacteria group bacterium]|nr:M23 family metallopeptidase [Patescibacteria group bacterium]